MDVPGQASFRAYKASGPPPLLDSQSLGPLLNVGFERYS